MSKSSITISITGLVFIASILGSFVIGTSLNRSPAHSAAADLALINNAVRFNAEFDRDPQSLGDIQAPQGSTGFFTYQGVLLDDMGSAAVGPVGLEFIVSSLSPVARIHTQITFNDIMPDGQGRIQVDLPLPDASTMSIWTDFFLTIRDPMTLVPIIDELPLANAPLAWISQHARSSDTSVFAQNAIFADLAQEADSLTNDDTVELTLTSDFDPAPIGGQPPNATRLGNMVFLSGAFRNNVNNPNGVILATLPPNMRPSETHILALHVSLSTTSGNAAVTITTDGTIRILSSAYTPGFAFFLNGVYFTVE
jgi:hypothetical protein